MIIMLLHYVGYFLLLPFFFLFHLNNVLRKSFGVYVFFF